MRVGLVALIATTVLSVAGAARAQTGQPVYVLSQDATGASSILFFTSTGAEPYSVSRLRSVPGSPDGIGVEGSGASAFLRDKTTNSVLAVSLTNTVAPIETISGLDTPGGFSVAGSTDTLYIVDRATDAVAVVPTRGPTANTVVSTIAGFSDPRNALAVTYFAASGSHDKLFVTNFATDTVAVAEGNNGVVTGVVASIPVGAGPNDLAYGGGSVFVANSGSNNISALNVNSLAVTDTINGVNQPTGMAVSPDGTTLYAVASGANQVDVIPLTGSAAYTVAATIPVGRGATKIAITTDGAQAYVLNTTDNSVSVLSLETNSLYLTLEGLGTVKALGIGSAPTTIVGAVLPGSRSVVQGDSATVFATIINAGPNPASACRINQPIGQTAPLSITTTATDPMTNAVIGIPNEPFALAVNVPQTFLLSFQSSAVTAMTTQPLQFFCRGIAPATYLPGVNTVDLAFGATATADVIALAATASGDGIVRVPLSSNGGAAAFAVASANVGAGAALTVTTDFGAAALPVGVTLCQTDPSSGQCLAPPASSVALTIAANAVPTFSIFVTASASLTAEPAVNRIYVRFLDARGISHGSTSVAIETD